MKRIGSLLICMLVMQQSIAQETIEVRNDTIVQDSIYIPSESNLAARQWFEDAKFGLFIHWGVYSILADGEWVMQRKNIAIDAYNKLPSFFNPTQYNAEEWVLMAKKCRHAIHHHHQSSSRWLFHVRLKGYRLQYRSKNTL